MDIIALITVQNGKKYGEILEFKKKNFNIYERRILYGMIIYLSVVFMMLTGEDVTNVVNCSAPKFTTMSHILEDTNIITTAAIGIWFILTLKSKRSDTWKRTWQYVN